MSVSKNWGQDFWATRRKKYYFISQPYLPYKKKQKKKLNLIITLGIMWMPSHSTSLKIKLILK